MLLFRLFHPVVHPNDKVTSGKNDVTVPRKLFPSITQLLPFGPGRMSALIQTGRLRFISARIFIEGFTAAKLEAQ